MLTYYLIKIVIFEFEYVIVDLVMHIIIYEIL
jgi:hypothetical protein